MEPNEDGGHNGQLELVAIAPNVVEAEPEEEDVNVFRVSPFLMPPVLRYVLKHVETPYLKDLRRTSSLWNQLTLEEMEQRAMKGEYFQLGFDWKRNLKTRRLGRHSNLWATKSFWNFFHQTKTHPNLFRSFYLHFPDAPLVLNRAHFSKFFVNYKPCIVNLALKRDLVFTGNARNLLRGFARWMAPTLRELTISNHFDTLVLPTIADQEDFDGIVFRNLRKLILCCDRSSTSSTYSAFTTLFGQGNCEMPKLTSLEISSRGRIAGQLDDLFGINTIDPIRWSTLTSLNIAYSRSINMTKYTAGLLFLAQSGMALKDLILNFYVFGDDFNHQTSGNLSQFLLSQANSIQHLGLNLIIVTRIQEDADPIILPKIYLPICPWLASLDISGNHFRQLNGIREHFELFNLISLPITFPRLSRLSLSSRNPTTMALFQKNVEPSERTHLDIFEYNGFQAFDGTHPTIWNEEDNIALRNNFSSVDLIKIN